MPPHNLATIAPPRTLANVLLDLKEARRDWESALADAEREVDYSQDESDAGDRMSEADNRIDELRDEFASQFQAATGLTWKQVETAIEEAVL